MDQTYLLHSYFASLLNFTKTDLMIINYYFTIVFMVMVKFATIVFGVELDDPYCHIDYFYRLCYQHVIHDRKSLHFHWGCFLILIQHLLKDRFWAFTLF